MTFSDEQLQQLKGLLDPLKKEITHSLLQAIKDSQEDTIKVLSEMIEAGYNMHEKRIKRLEDNASLPPLPQN